MFMDYGYFITFVKTEEWYNSICIFKRLQCIKISFPKTYTREIFTIFLIIYVKKPKLSLYKKPVQNT